MMIRPGDPGDGLSRYYAQNDLYSTQNRPAKKSPEALRPFSTQELRETPQERSARELADRFHANSFGIPNEKLVVVAKVGKYLFFAAMAPPYLVLYALPKWIAHQLLPYTYQRLKKAVEQLFHPLTKLAHLAQKEVQRVSKLLVKRWEKIFQVTKDLFYDPFRRLFSDLFQQTKRLTSTLRAQLRQRVAALRQAIHQRAASLIEKLSVAPKRLLGALQQRALAWSRRQREKLLAPWRSLQKIRANSSHWLHYPVTRARQLLTAFHRQKERVEQLHQQLVAWSERAKLQLLDRRQKLVAPLHRLSEQLAAAKTAFLKTRLAVSFQQFFNEQLPAAFQFAYQQPINWWHQARRLAKTKLVAPLQEKRSRLAAKAASACKWGQQQLSIACAALIQKGRNYLRTLLAKPRQFSWRALLSRAKQLFDEGQKPPKRFWLNAKAGSHRLAKRVAAACQPFVFKVKRACLWTKLFTLWIAILTGFWCLSLRRIGEALERLEWRDLHYLARSIGSRLRLPRWPSFRWAARDSS